MNTLRMFTRVSLLGLLLFNMVLISNAITSAQDDATESLVAADLGNHNSAADIRVSFETEAGEAQIFVAKAGSDFDIETAENGLTLTAENGENRVWLTEDMLDVDGDPITEGLAYEVYVATGDTLLGPSDELTLENAAVVYTIVSNIPVAAGGLETDNDGNIYFADFGEGGSAEGISTWLITPDGDTSVFVEGNGIQTATGNAFDSEGNFYQSSFAGDQIVRVGTDGEISTYTSEGLRGPVGIAFDAEDNLFVANCLNGSVRRITPDGESERLVLSAFFACANGITLDDDGNVYVSNFRNSNVIKVTPDGEATVFAQLPGNNNAHILYHDGMFFAASRGGHQLFTISLEGEVTVLAGTGERGNDDGLALEATFALPNDMALSPDASVLYINDVVADSDGTNYPSNVRAIVLERAE